MKKHSLYKINIFALILIFSIQNAYSTAINFSGQIDIIEVDNGTGIYSGTPIDTKTSGFIDDVTFNGEISNGTTLTSFSCCIAAGKLNITNDAILDADAASTLNLLTGATLYNVGDKVDLIDIEGDKITPGGGRIEVGLSYTFKADTFNNENLDNYPFDPNAVQFVSFFILEENQIGEDIYLILGKLKVEPLPTSPSSHLISIWSYLLD